MVTERVFLCLFFSLVDAPPRAAALRVPGAASDAQFGFEFADREGKESVDGHRG